MIRPVILCGGSGTRLWPLSRKSYPKQFVPLVGEQTLFQGAARRMSGDLFDQPVVITNSDFRFIVAEQLQEVGIEPGTILIEPEGRNTGPAILAAALYLAKENPETVMLVAPSDHIIKDTEAFQSAVREGLAAVERGQLVTFGISPTHAETAYGYLELAGDRTGGPIPIKRFIEKPDYLSAVQMLSTDTFLWNAGIFLFRANDIISAFELYAPNLISSVAEAVEKIQCDIGFFRLCADAWVNVDNISIDHAVMEKANNLSVVPFSGCWSDLGGWDSVWRESAKTNDGVHTSTDAIAIDCTNTLLRSDSERLAVVGIGLNNIIVVAMHDAVLIADMSRAQDVKKVVKELQANGVAQGTSFPKDHRPWGWFESLVIGERFQVKRIQVHPGASLSLQSHQHRSEHWIVVSGQARVTIEGKVQILSENESVFVPLGAVHRIANLGTVPVVLIEVQTGDYFGEDDIIRYEDVYARGNPANN